MNINPLVRLSELGQSIWLDYISRGLLESGRLGRMVEDDALRGVTTNPATTTRYASQALSEITVPHPRHRQMRQVANLA